MKKAAILVLALSLALPLGACGSERIALTTENVSDYLSISVDVTDCRVNEDRGEFMGIPVYDISGEAEVEVSTMVQSDVQFEDVELTLELRPANLDWQFVRGNEQRVNRYDETVNYKALRLSIPFDGETTATEEMELVTERIMGSFELSTVQYEVTDISGYAIVK